MLTVYKYVIPAQGYFELNLPVNAKILHIAMQHTNPKMWVLLNPNNIVRTRKFIVVGTGRPIKYLSKELKHITTFLMNDGQLVFHVFELFDSCPGS